MTVKEVAQKLNLIPINEADTTRSVTGCYIGDLLSRAMIKAGKDNLWITIMVNVNVAAVAVLTDVSAIILAEDQHPSEDFVIKASEHGINLYKSSLSAYELAVSIGKLSR